MAGVADRRSFEKRAKVSGRRDRAVGVISGIITIGMSGIKSLGRLGDVHVSPPPVPQ